jgi:hypothetical protein
VIAGGGAWAGEQARASEHVLGIGHEELQELLFARDELQAHRSSRRAMKRATRLRVVGGHSLRVFRGAERLQRLPDGAEWGP